MGEREREYAISSLSTGAVAHSHVLPDNDVFLFFFVFFYLGQSGDSDSSPKSPGEYGSDDAIIGDSFFDG